MNFFWKFFSLSFLLIIGAFSNQLQANQTIESIEFKGAHAFDWEALEQACGISLGESIPNSASDDALARVRNLYFNSGFREVRVDLIEEVLGEENGEKEKKWIFEIQEPRFLKIASIDIQQESALGFIPFKPVEWKNFAKDCLEHFPLKVGNFASSDVIDQAIKALANYLLSQDKINFKIKVKREKVQEQIALVLQIDPGEQLQVGFQGNEVLSAQELYRIVDEKIASGLSEDIVLDLKKTLISTYQKLGYAKVEVRPRLYEDLERNRKKVSFEIHEGPQITIRSVEFDGNFTISDDILREVFFSKTTAMVQKKIFVESEVTQAALALVEWMKKKGYLTAKFFNFTATFEKHRLRNASSSQVNLKIYFYEGEQTFLESVQIEGNTFFTKDQILMAAHLKEGKPFNLFNLSESLEQIKKKYNDQGFLDFKIVNEGYQDLVRYTKENRFAQLYLSFSEGSRYRIKEIETRGLKKTQSSVIFDELPLKEGDFYSAEVLGESLLKLRRLGLFTEIKSDVIPVQGETGKIILVLFFQEADRINFTLTPGFRNDMGARLSSQVTRINLWGLAHSLSISADANRRVVNYQFVEGHGSVDYAWPNFLMRGLYFKPLLSASRTQYPKFSANTFRFQANFEKQLLAQPQLKFSFTYSFERNRQFLAVQAAENQAMTLGTLTPRLSLDLRDQPMSPHSGWYSTVWLDYAGPALGSFGELNGNEDFQIQYYRAQARLDTYVPLKENVTLFLSFRTGFEKSLEPSSKSSNPGSSGAIPLIKQFTLGGVNSVRGYKEQSINYQEKIIRTSMSYVNYRSELQFPFIENLKLGIFMDAANLMIDRYSLDKLLIGYGTGLHLDSPLGSLNLDLGIKYKPLPIEDLYVVHFSVGII